MDKFELYSKRNIFSENILGKRSLAAASLQLSEDDHKLLEQAREKFVTSQSELLLAKQRLQETETLLKEMRDIMFSMRVQHQRFEETPLDHSLVSLQSQQRALQDLIARSEGKIFKIIYATFIKYFFLSNGHYSIDFSFLLRPVGPIERLGGRVRNTTATTSEVVAAEAEASVKAMSRMSYEQASTLFAAPVGPPRPAPATATKPLANVRRLTTSVRTPAKSDPSK